MRGPAARDGAPGLPNEAQLGLKGWKGDEYPVLRRRDAGEAGSGTGDALSVSHGPPEPVCAGTEAPPTLSAGRTVVRSGKEVPSAQWKPLRTSAGPGRGMGGRQGRCERWERPPGGHAAEARTECACGAIGCRKDGGVAEEEVPIQLGAQHDGGDALQQAGLPFRHGKSDVFDLIDGRQIWVRGRGGRWREGRRLRRASGLDSPCGAASAAARAAAASTTCSKQAIRPRGRNEGAGGRMVTAPYALPKWQFLSHFARARPCLAE